MDNATICELIRRSSLTRDLDTEQCGVLAGIATTRSLKDQEILIAQGEVDDTLHIIGSGALAVERSIPGGEKVTLHVLKPGDLAGEMGFVDGTEHTATLRAMGDTSVVSLHRKDLESLLKDQAAIVYGLMRGIVRSVHRILREMNLQAVELNNYITKTHGRY